MAVVRLLANRRFSFFVKLRSVAPGHELISSIYGIGYRLNAGGSDGDE